MSNGLIYAVIVGLWAVVLLPMWLRRHDDASESRSVDRFEGAMRTLSRRSAVAGDRREVLLPKRAAEPTRPDHAPRVDPVAAATARRRRTALVLLGLAVLLLLTGLVGLLPLWLAVVPILLLGGFLWQARVSASRASARELSARRARAAAARRQREQALDARYAAGTVRGPEARPEVPVEHPTVPVEGLPVPATPLADDDQFYDAVAEHVWDPVPVPLPTYVTAPKAPRSVRVIDLTKPGAWADGGLEVQAEPVPEDADVRVEPAPQPQPDRDGIVVGEVLIERRRVVNE